jgi:DNA processing protein
MARGIDQEAHRAAIDAGGATYAVLGSGLLRPYPAGQERLMEEIRDNGAILSEYHPFQQARRFHFPERNRILACLGRDVLVVQAAARSGSLITAFLAVDLGGSVYVVPDRIDQDMARGCMKLLREGATPVTTPRELAGDLGLELDGGDSGGETGDPIWKLLGDSSRTIDELVLESGGSLSEVLGKIAAWELEGRVQRTPTGRIRRTARFR